MDKNVGKNKAYVCFTCSAHFDSPRKLRLHFEDTLHQPKSKLKVFIPEITMPSKNSALKDYMKRKFRDPVIGLEHVVEYRAYVDDKKEIVVEYICELCKFHSGSERMMLHLTGLRHTKIVMAKKYSYILKAQLRENEDKTQFLRQMARQIERSEGTKTYRVDAASNEKILRKYRIPALKEKREKKRKVRWDERENSEILRKTALEYLEQVYADRLPLFLFDQLDETPRIGLQFRKPDNFEIDSDTETANFAKLTQKLAWDLRVYALRADPNTPFPDTIMKANELALSIIESDNSKKPKKFHIVSEEKKPLNSEGADRTQREVQTEHGAAATRNSMKGKGPSITVAREPETAGYTAERGWTESEAQMRFGTSRRSMEEEHISFTLAQGTAETAERSWAKTEFQTRLGLAGSSMQEEYTAAHYGFMAPEMLENSSGSGGDIRSSQKPVLQGAYFPANIPHPDDKYKMAETPVNQSTQYRAHFLSQQNVEKGPTLPKFTKSAQKETVPQSSQDTQLLLDSVPQKDVKMEDITFFKQLVGLMAALPQNKSATEKIAMDPKLMLFKALLQNRTTNTESIQNNLKLLMQMPSLTPANKSTENIQLIQKLLMINASQAQSNQSKDDVYFNQKLMLTGQQAPSSTQNILFNQMMITTTVDQNAANLENPQLNPNSVLQTGTVVQNNQSAESIQPIQNQVVHMPSLINQHSLSQVNPGYQNTQTLYSEAYDINMQGQQGYVNTAQNYGVGAYGKSQESTPDYMSYQGSYGTQYNDANGNAVGIPTYTSSENPQNQYQNMSFSSEMYLRNSEWKATYGQSYSEQSPVTLAQDPSLYNQEKQHTAPYSTVRLTPSVANMSQESQISRLQETTYSKREREDKYFVPQSDEWIQQQSSLKMRHDNGFYKSRPPSYSSTRKYCKDETRAQDRGLARSDSQHVKRARLDTDQVPSYRSNSAKGSSCRSKETSELLGLNTEGLPKEILKRIQGKDLFTASAIISEYKESLH